jgi:hypothetical protein
MREERNADASRNRMGKPQRRRNDLLGTIDASRFLIFLLKCITDRGNRATGNAPGSGARGRTLAKERGADRRPPFS